MNFESDYTFGEKINEGCAGNVYSCFKIGLPE